MRGLGKGASGKPYPRMCNARRSRLEPGTFRSQAVRLYRLHQARPSAHGPIGTVFLFCRFKGHLQYKYFDHQPLKGSSSPYGFVFSQFMVGCHAKTKNGLAWYMFLFFVNKSLQPEKVQSLSSSCVGANLLLHQDDIVGNPVVVRLSFRE